MTRLVLLIILLTLLTGCVSQPTPIIIVVTATLEPTPTLTPGPPLTATLESTNTPTTKPRPTWTPRPTRPPVSPTPKPTPTPEPRFISTVVDQTQDRGGVIVTIASFHLTPRSDHPKYDAFSRYNDVVTFGIFDIRVENTLDRIINVYPAFGTAVVGNEQVGIEIFGSDDVGGELYPGVIKEGRIFFGLKRHQYDEVQHVLYVFDPPHDQDYKNLSDEDYRFEFDVP